MKNKLFTLMLIVCSSLFLVNCAKNNSSGTVPGTGVGVAGTCTTAGYVYTQQYGCVPQGNCPVGYGSINGSCFPAVSAGVNGSCGVGQTYTQQYGCLPQSQMCGANYMQYGYYSGQCIPGTTTTGVGGTCQAGYVGTQLGCLPQGNCQAGYGYYYGVVNGQSGAWCIPRTY